LYVGVYCFFILTTEFHGDTLNYKNTIKFSILPQSHPG